MSEIKVEVYCQVCGEKLCQYEKVGKDCHNCVIRVSPCKKCLEKARNAGYDAGYAGYWDEIDDAEEEED